MIKERVWPVRVMYMLIAAALVISLIITAAPALKVSADPGLSEWDRVPTPTAEDWVLSKQSAIIDATTVPGGEVAYAIVEQHKGGTYFYLLKSTDSAATWDDITDALEDELDDNDYINSLLKVACDPEDPDFVAVALDMRDDSAGADEVHVFISEDGGATFRDTGEVEDGGVEFPTGGFFVFALAVAPEDDGMRNIAIGGTTGTAALLFRCLALGDIGTGWMDATDYDGWDDEGEPTAFTSLAVVNIHIPDSWSADNTILVATANDDTVWLQCGTWGTTEGWNADSNLAIDAVLIADPVSVTVPPLDSIPWSFLGPGTASITTPLDYSGRYADKRYVWVNVNYYDSGMETYGTIFRVKNVSVNPIGWQVEEETLWLTNVSYLGYISEGKAIAGVMGDGEGRDGDGLTDCCWGVDVYRNDNIVTMDICCYDWEAACKRPTGRGPLKAFFVSTDKAYAFTVGPVHSYDESAWSVSFDDGDIWNQLSLIDTRIDYLSDVAVSPDCNKMMLVSINDRESDCDCDSVWLHAENLPEAEEYSGKWLRTWCGQLDADDWGLLRLAPEETTGDTVYLVDYYGDTVYWNEMETLGCWEQGTATVDEIVDLAVKDKETIYALDSSGTVAMSDDFAVGWHTPVDSKVQDGYTIAVWGDDIIVGGEDSDVSHSDDGGETFTELEDVATVNCYVTVAFDSYFDINAVIYAGLDDDSTAVPASGVYRWVIDESDEWKDLRAEPLESQIGIFNGASGDENVEVNFTGLVLDNADGNPMTSPDTGGVLYASYYGYWDGDWFTGVARYLTPAEDVICKECGDWDYLIEGLTIDVEGFEAWPDALKICGCLTPDSNSKLFAIDEWYYYDMEDGEEGAVWSFEDCYAKAAPDLISPADDSIIASDPCYCWNMPFTLKWDRQCDACSYDIQLALDEDFTELMVDEHVAAAGGAPSYFVDQYLVCEFTYYWRVRSADAETGQYIRSWWSETQSFTIAPGPAAAITLTAPDNGVTNVPLTDIGFTWTTVQSADEYDWVLSANADLSAPVETKAGLTDTACTFTGTLAYDTVYYWQVTALKDGTSISQSNISTFTTRPEPDDVVPPPEPTTPPWVWVVIAIGAVLVIVVIVLIFRTRRV